MLICVCCVVIRMSCILQHSTGNIDYNYKLQVMRANGKNMQYIHASHARTCTRPPPHARMHTHTPTQNPCLETTSKFYNYLLCIAFDFIDSPSLHWRIISSCSPCTYVMHLLIQSFRNSYYTFCNGKTPSRINFQFIIITSNNYYVGTLQLLIFM